MSHAGLALSFAPTVPAAGPALRQAALVMGRAVGFALSCAAAAAFLWLVLAGPGLVSDHASTVAGRHAVR